MEALSADVDAVTELLIQHQASRGCIDENGKNRDQKESPVKRRLYFMQLTM